MSNELEDDDHGGDIRDYIDTQGHWLDYEIKREFSASKPPERLVRFMPIEQYLSLLTTKQIYVPRATEYDDPYDCAFPGSLDGAIHEALLESSDEPEFALPGDADHYGYVRKAEDLLAEELADDFSDEVPDRWFVSCWHAGEALTDLMWRSYGGHKGVCLSCDGPALLKQFQDTAWVRRNALTDKRGLENFSFYYGYVDYEKPVFEVETDLDSGPRVIVRPAAFHKHRFFRLDQEYRFAAKLTTKDTLYYSAGADFDFSACNASVSASPLCPRWIAESLKSVTRQYYSKIDFSHLSLE